MGNLEALSDCWQQQSWWEEYRWLQVAGLGVEGRRKAFFPPVASSLPWKTLWEMQKPSFRLMFLEMTQDFFCGSSRAVCTMTCNSTWAIGRWQESWLMKCDSGTSLPESNVFLGSHYNTFTIQCCLWNSLPLLNVGPCNYLNKTASKKYFYFPTTGCPITTTPIACSLCWYNYML